MPRNPQTPRVRRRGSALLLVLMLTVAVAAVALSAIELMGSGTLLGDYYDREGSYRYSAEAALAIGKAQLTKDTTIHLPDSGYVTLLSGAQILDALGNPVPRVRVNLYAGRSGNVDQSYGQYASVVAEAYDAMGTRFVRRLELQAENFARFGLFTNNWSGVCYGDGDFIRGRGHSNQDWQSCGSPDYYDTITTVGAATGGTPTFHKGHVDGIEPINLPSSSRLTIIQTRAAGANLDITSVGTSAATVQTRLEFVGVDLNNDTLLIGANEGFFRVYQGATSLGVRADPVPGTTHGPDDQCGDWHIDSTTVPRRAKFYPISVHNADWFLHSFGGIAPPDFFSGSITSADRDVIMSNAGFRCYPRGDPHLVATERPAKLSLPAPLPADYQKGGEDTTFTDSTTFGFWQRFPGNSAPVTAALNAIPANTPYVGYREQDRWLWPLGTGLNAAARGAIHVHGPIALSGVLRGMVTVYAQTSGGQLGEVAYIDDLVYVQDPTSVPCANLLGVISDGSQKIADNAINSPQRAAVGFPYRWADGNDNGVVTANDFVFDGVMMTLTGTIGVENYNQHPESMKMCGATNSGRGCIRQAGGIIEHDLSPTSTGSGDGFGADRVVDQCLNTNAPPYFPTTGRYVDNRFYEMDPARFDVASLFRTLQAGY